MAVLPTTTRDLSLWFTGLRTRRCSCGLGPFLALLMITGLMYLAFFQPDTEPGATTKKLLPNLRIANGNRWMKDSPFFNRFWNSQRLPNLPPKLRLGLLRHISSRNTTIGSSNEVELPFLPSRSSPEDLVWLKRQAAVVDAFKHAWRGYKKFALGYDELRPDSRSGVDGLGGLGATAVDALDTAMIMGLDDVVQEAGGWIEKELPKRLSGKGQVNLFETTIRVLGGLLNAYHLSGGDKTVAGIDGSMNGLHLSPGPNPEVYLNLAKDLGDRLTSAFEMSPSAIPFSDVVLSERRAHPAGSDGGAISTSEATTLQLEFWYLSKVTGDPNYGKAAMRVFELLVESIH